MSTHPREITQSADRQAHADGPTRNAAIAIPGGRPGGATTATADASGLARGHGPTRAGRARQLDVIELDRPGAPGASKEGHR